MKMKQLLVVMVAVLLMVGFAACSNDNENDLVKSDSQELFSYVMRSAKVKTDVKTTSKDIFPDWLVDIIDSWEASGPQIAAVFSAKWKGKQIYYIYTILQSSYFSEVYNADGTAPGIVTNSYWEDIKAFLDESTDWCLAYCTDSFYNIFQERIRGNLQK